MSAELSFVLSQYRRVTDGRTDRQTYRPSRLDHACIQCSVVKMAIVKHTRSTKLLVSVVEHWHKFKQIKTQMNKMSSKRSKACEIHPVVASLNQMYRSRTGKCTEVDLFTACAYLCTKVDLYQNRLPFVPNASCTELHLPHIFNWCIRHVSVYSAWTWCVLELGTTGTPWLEQCI